MVQDLGNQIVHTDKSATCSESLKEPLIPTKKVVICTVFENHRIVSCEANYIYILSGQKFIKNAKNSQFWRVFEKLKRAVKQRQRAKIGGKWQN